MAYYSYNYEQPYPGENSQTPYGGNYESVVPFQNLYFEYDRPTHSAVAYDYDPGMTGSIVSYSVSSLSEHKSFMCDPYHSHAVTHQFRISYSVQEFNEPEFEEYDPTPYGGGYDLALTYGSPLPPSEVTCYPRSSPDSSASHDLPPKENFEEAPSKPQIESKPTPMIEENKQQQLLQPDNGDDKGSKEHGNVVIQESPTERPSDPIQAEDSVNSHGDEGIDCESAETSVGVAHHVPPGYGLEAVDLCESLFGYWPCIARYNKELRSCQEVGNEESNCNQWKETADYLFGSSYPYDNEGKDGTSCYAYGDSTHGYQHQSLYRQF